MCNQGSIEEEYHALVECQAYNRERDLLYNQIWTQTQRRLDVRRMANNREWMLLVLLGPGMLDNGTNVIAKAVSNFLYYSAKKRQKLLVSR